MNELVLDASVILKWFRASGERHAHAAALLRKQFERGELAVFAPPLLFLEVVNIAARRWKWDVSALAVLAAALTDLELRVREPDLKLVAQWTALGLTAYDAAYVALAEEEGLRLVTDDELICATAANIAVALGA